jgi:hypothetical protein
VPRPSPSPATASPDHRASGATHERDLRQQQTTLAAPLVNDPG